MNLNAVNQSYHGFNQQMASAEAERNTLESAIRKLADEIERAAKIGNAAQHVADRLDGHAPAAPGGEKVADVPDALIHILHSQLSRLSGELAAIDYGLERISRSI
jgi:hypothetical protein